MSRPVAQLYHSDLITDIVIGMSDGLTIPFALTAGLASVVSSNTVILTAGLAVVAAGAVAMGLGGYLAGRAETADYSPQPAEGRQPETLVPGQEMRAARDVFAEMGLGRETREIIAEEMARDKEQWMAFVSGQQLSLDRPAPKSARKSALNIGIFYIAGGLIPLTPYFFSAQPLAGLKWSCLLTVVCLFAFGFFKARFTGRPAWKGALQVTGAGLVAAATALLIAQLFK